MQWIKFDLHQHTKNELTSDRRTPNNDYTHKKFHDLLKEQGVGLKSVTNHNSINIIDHVKYALICNNLNIAYLPGVEIDYDLKGERFHAISILNPSYDIIKYAHKLKSITDSIDESNDIYLNKDDFANLHLDIEFIFIPHYMKTKGIRKQQNKVLHNTENWVIDMILDGNAFPVIFENTKDYHKYTLSSVLEKNLTERNLKYYGAAQYTGSDSKIDNDLKRAEISLKRVNYNMFAQPTYRGLEIAVRNHNQRIVHDREIITRGNYIEEIVFSKNKKFSNVGNIRLSSGLNVIIGSSGSGKTLLLNEIFYKLNNKSLSDVQNRKKEGSKRAYSNIINDENWIKLNFKADTTPKAIEIPSLYGEILKYTDNPTKLGSLLNVTNNVEANLKYNNYINEVSQYQNLLRKKSQNLKNGNELLVQMHTAIDFLNHNKIDTTDYVLNIKEPITIEKDNLNNKINKINSLINNKEPIIKYFQDIHKLIKTEESETLINEIIKNYESIILLLLKEKEKSSKEFNLHELDFIIRNIINKEISNKSKELGNKQVLVRERRSTLHNLNRELIINIKRILVNDIEMDKIDLTFPYKEIQEELSVDTDDKIARYQLSYPADYFETFKIIDENPFINFENKIVKLRKYNDSINFFSRNEVMKLVVDLTNDHISFNDFLKRELVINLQLSVDDKWKDINRINPGDVSKVSMEYYFNNMIKKEQPDVIIIDQPENDLDKDFITNVLSKFIRDNKIHQQIIVTSHDPILTVNSDVNTIIESNVLYGNKFEYRSYQLEETDGNTFVTDRVARILDGNKENIKNRYQLYGGILRNEN